MLYFMLYNLLTLALRTKLLVSDFRLTMIETERLRLADQTYKTNILFSQSQGSCFTENLKPSIVGTIF